MERFLGMGLSLEETMGAMLHYQYCAQCQADKGRKMSVSPDPKREGENQGKGQANGWFSPLFSIWVAGVLDTIV